MGVARLERRSIDSGELENADSVMLSNLAATASITRDSDGAVMVVAGAAVANPSTGVYEYDWTTLGLDPSASYTVHWKVA